MNIFLLMGQSNMAGRGDPDAVDPIRDPDILVFDEDGGEWRQGDEPLHHDRETAGIGLGMSFARRVLEAYAGARIGLVPCAIGGSPIRLWMPGEIYHRRTLSLAEDAAAASGAIKGVLWHQGESDAGDETRAEAYYDRLTEMIASLRRDLGSETLPVVLGELGPFLARNEALPYYSTVDQALRRAANSLPCCALVSAEGLEDQGDLLHFNAQALRTFGQRYAEAYLALVRSDDCLK